MPDGFVQIARTGDVAAGKMKRFEIAGERILLANVDGHFCAVADTCTHEDASLSAGSLITIEQRVIVRMAATHAIHKAREAVDFAYNAAGATAIFDNHPLERRFRDIHTVTQQLQGRLSHFETVGAWMLGVDADLTFV